MAGDPRDRTSPGDAAPEGMAGAGEDVCRRCQGAGQVAEGASPDSGGTGLVAAAIGGA